MPRWRFGKSVWCGLAVAAFIAPAVRAEVKSATPHGFIVENVELVSVDAATAWAALVGEVDRWWPRAHTWWGAESTLSIAPSAAGCFCEIAGARQARHMEVAFVDPPHLLRMVGGLGPLQAMGLHGALDWRLESIEAETRITLRYQVGGFATEDLAKLASVVDRVQGQQLRSLAQHLRASTAAASRQ
jgi:hypothetical protein